MRRILVTFSIVALAAFSVGCAEQDDVGTLSQAIEGGQCPADWYTATPPNPDWDLPPLGTPLVYYDTEFAGIVFLAPLAALQSQLPPGVYAYEAVPGLGLFSLAFWNHRDNENMSPYREWGASIAVYDSSMYEGFIPLYNLQLAVTTEAAKWIGVEGWGLPKFVGNVHCREVAPKGIKCMVSEGDQLIAKVEFATTDMVPWQVPPYLVMSTKDGQMVRAPWFITSNEAMSSYTMGGAKLTLGEHPIGQWMGALGVGMFPSIQQAWVPHMASTFYPGLCSAL